MLSWVLEAVTSVSRKCSSIIGEDLSVAFVCLESGDMKQTYPGLGFLTVWHGGIPDSLLLLFVFFVPVRDTACCFPLFCVCSRVVSLFYLRFVPLLSVLFFP